MKEQKQLMAPDSAQRGLQANGWRIAFCIPQLQPLHEVRSGKLTQAAYIQQAYIADALQARGHHLTFIAPRSLFDIVCTTDLRVPTLAKPSWSGTRAFVLLSKLTWRVQRLLGVPYLNFFSNLRLFDACLHCLPGHDLVHERNSLYRVGIAMACKRLKLPYVLFFDADPIFEQDFVSQPITGILRWRAEQMMRYTLKVADGIICVCSQAKAHLVKNYQVPEQKIAVFPNGVDVERFRPRPEMRCTVRDGLGIGDNPMLIFVGAFYPWHDVQTLLEAFAQVLKRFPRAHLLLVGDGGQRQSMESYAVRLGLGDSVRFSGLVPHSRIPEFLSAADVALVPLVSREHDFWGSPTKLFEYLACGAAVVATAVGQVAEVIEDGVNGLLVPARDAAALATAIERLLADPALRARLGRQAREDAVRKHSWERYVARLERVYEAALMHRPVGEV